MASAGNGGLIIIYGQQQQQGERKKGLKTLFFFFLVFKTRPALALQRLCPLRDGAAAALPRGRAPGEATRRAWLALSRQLGQWLLTLRPRCPPLLRGSPFFPAAPAAEPGCCWSPCTDAPSAEGLSVCCQRLPESIVTVARYGGEYLPRDSPESSDGSEFIPACRGCPSAWPGTALGDIGDRDGSPPLNCFAPFLPAVGTEAMPRARSSSLPSRGGHRGPSSSSLPSPSLLGTVRSGDVGSPDPPAASTPGVPGWREAPWREGAQPSPG